MKHAVTEFYTIEGRGVYHKSFMDGFNGVDYRIGHKHYIINNSKKDGEFYYITPKGRVKAWLYGEKTWFDTKEERDEYRAQRNAEMAEKRANKAKRQAIIEKVLNYCESLSDEELANFLSKIDG